MDKPVVREALAGQSGTARRTWPPAPLVVPIESALPVVRIVPEQPVVPIERAAPVVRVEPASPVVPIKSVVLGVHVLA